MPYIHLSTSTRLSDAQIVDIRKAVYDLIPMIPGKTYVGIVPLKSPIEFE